MIAIGLDHRCVHAVVHVAVRHPKVISYRRRHLKHWKPFMNARNEAHAWFSNIITKYYKHMLSVIQGHR